MVHALTPGHLLCSQQRQKPICINMYPMAQALTPGRLLPGPGRHALPLFEEPLHAYGLQEL